jgi:DnaJ like chaperone protein
MPSKKSFLDSLKDSIHEIVSGNETTDLSGQKQHQQSARNEIEAAIIVLVTEVMRLSGNYTSETEKILYDFLDKNFTKANTSKRKKSVHDHLFAGPQPFTRMACEQIKTLTTPESKQEIIRLLYEVASLDGLINAKEEEIIRKIAKYLAIPGEEFKAIREKYTGIHDPFVKLEMQETVSVIEVRAAYRKMALKYHPDKRTDSVDKEEANRKFREIKKAYEAILKKLK